MPWTGTEVSRIPLTEFDPQAFAETWESDWNSHDLDRILSHYSSSIVFRSLKAIPLVGAGEIIGKENLRIYWQQALLKQPDLRFTVEQFYLGHQMMQIAYRNHKGVNAIETLEFDDDGLVVRASACHAPELDRPSG